LLFLSPPRKKMRIESVSSTNVVAVASAVGRYGGNPCGFAPRKTTLLFIKIRLLILYVPAGIISTVLGAAAVIAALIVPESSTVPSLCSPVIVLVVHPSLGMPPITSRPAGYHAILRPAGIAYSPSAVGVANAKNRKSKSVPVRCTIEANRLSSRFACLADIRVNMSCQHFYKDFFCLFYALAVRTVKNSENVNAFSVCNTSFSSTAHDSI
jgi:hypothetical protein